MDSSTRASRNSLGMWSGALPADPLAPDILAAQRGCEDALGRLFDAYRNYLLKVANQVLPTHVRGKFGPSDVVQETLLQLGRDFAEFHGSSEAELKVWMRESLLRHARNMTRNYTRTKMRQLTREVPLEDADRSEPISLVDDGPASPPARLLAGEEAAALVAALARLPEAHRRVIVLRHWEGWSFLQIGEVLGRSDDAARKLWRGRS